MTSPLLGSLYDPPGKVAIRFGEIALTYEELRNAAARIPTQVEEGERVAVWATSTIETCIGVAGILAAGAVAVPINPGSGSVDLEHIVSDARPLSVVAAADVELPPALATLQRIVVEASGPNAALPDDIDLGAPAFVVYTSGTTGPPKGVVLSRRAVSSNLDALAEIWEWTDEDVLVHGLPLFHVHGLILGVLGPIRRGGTLEHVGRFSPEAIGGAVAAGGTMVFGVPTMYHRLADAAEADASLAGALRSARILVSGSAPLPAPEHARIERLTGQRIIERYGLTETLMNCSVRATGDRKPGYVGPPVPGVDVRLVDDDRNVLDVDDDDTIGEIEVRGPNLFTEYLNRPDATAEAVQDGWFLTGDLATRAPDGYIRIVGRRATDLIKTGGFKVGAGEVENSLLEHGAVAEAAVIGEPDDDLGERIVAFVVLRPGAESTDSELMEHVGESLARHKRPRSVHFLEELPRNEMGKIRKSELASPDR